MESWEEIKCNKRVEGTFQKREECHSFAADKNFKPSICQETQLNLFDYKAEPFKEETFIYKKVQ